MATTYTGAQKKTKTNITRDLSTCDRMTAQRIFCGDWFCIENGLSGELLFLMGFFRNVDDFLKERDALVEILTEAEDMHEEAKQQALYINHRETSAREIAETAYNETREELGWVRADYLEAIGTTNEKEAKNEFKMAYMAHKEATKAWNVWRTSEELFAIMMPSQKEILKNWEG